MKWGQDGEKKSLGGPKIQIMRKYLFKLADFTIISFVYGQNTTGCACIQKHCKILYESKL